MQHSVIEQSKSTDHLSEKDKWRIVLTRDHTYNGTFVYAVRSTGIYCKPSCPARRPRVEHVVFFSSTQDAEQAGFRPCQRCHPRDGPVSPQTELVKRICQYITANLEDKLTLSVFSAHFDVSPFHLQRTFKRILGISPRQYVEAQRLAKFKQRLREGDTVNRALYAAGFTSRSRLYEKGSAKFGMSPSTYRRGGRGMVIKYTIVDCPLGRLLVATTEQGICAVYLGDSDATLEDTLSKEYPAAEIQQGDRDLKEWLRPFLDYFSGNSFDFDLPLDVKATAFQWKVWKEIQAIPAGNTSTYSRIAKALGKPQAARAVAKACASNPVSIVIPCHRVIRKDGKLGGYRGGIKRKQALLTHEKAISQKTLDQSCEEQKLSD